MLPRDQDYARARRRIETAVGRPELTLDGVVQTVLEETADVLGVTSACWHKTDPAAGALVDGAQVGGAPGSLEESLVYEYRRPDVNRFVELAGARDKVAAISTSTDGRPSSSARFREMIEPGGAADELRVAFSDAYGMWMSLVMFTGRRVTEDDLRFVSEIVPAATHAMRALTARSLEDSAAAADPDDGSAPSVLLLDAGDHIISADAVARRRLALLPGPGGDQAPGVMSFLAARARWDRAGGPATARMRALDGRWFVIDASVLDDAGSGNVAAVIQPAPSELVLDVVLRAMGLTAREREVAALLAQGRPTKSIAAMLQLSPWTVQDHVKAVYAKTGVSRADLGASGRSAGDHELSRGQGVGFAARGADEHRRDAQCLGAGDVGDRVVAHHPAARRVTAGAQRVAKRLGVRLVIADHRRGEDALDQVVQSEGRYQRR